MRTQHWVIWVIGWLATLAMVAGIAFLKGGPDWYASVFVIAASYCIAARAAMAYVRRTRRQVPTREAWLHALSAARVGFLVVIAVAVVMAGIGVLALAAK
jgi:hypothetical protein